VILGNTSRPFYNAGKVNSAYSSIYALSNTTKGYAYNIALSLTKVFSRGWNASLSYSLGHSYGVIDGTSSTAASNFRYNYNINGLNNVDMARNNYDQGSRIVGYAGKRFHYGKIFTTTIGLVYTGNSGGTFSYVYYGDINGDDGSTVARLSTAGGADLIYMPSDASQFVTKTFTINGSSVTMSPEDQFNAFKEYMNSTKYLRNHIGKNTERNGDRMPWESHFDLKLEEGIAVYKEHTLSITVNIFNVANLLSSKWGHSYYLNNQEQQPLDVDHFVDNGNGTVTPYWYFNPAFGLNSYTHKPWQYNDFMSRWNMQIGLRYSF
jgi:hypothetical protein